MNALARGSAFLLLGVTLGCGAQGGVSSGDGTADGSIADGAIADGGVSGNANESGASRGPMDAAGECADAAWQAIPVPAEAATDTFASVTGTGASDMWACSTNGLAPPASEAVHLLHWNGTTLAESSAPRACWSLWASAPGEVWAGGVARAVDHLVNAQWTSVDLGDQRSAFAIWGNRPSNVWFAGVNYNGGHWNGTSLWTDMEGDAAVLDLQGTSLWGTGDEDLWVLAGATASGTATSVSHVNEGATGDAAYEPSASAGALDVDASLSVLAGVWAADDAHVWVVGSGGFIGFFDGRSWSQQVSPTSRDLTSIWGSSASDAWAVGSAGTIVHWDGTAWSLSAAPVATNLLAVTGTDACNVWTVGEGGTVLALRE